MCSTIPDLGGTSDHFMLYVDGGKVVCHIFDYKHGIGVPVDVTENKQVLSYAVIIASHYGTGLTCAWHDRSTTRVCR